MRHLLVGFVALAGLAASANAQVNISIGTGSFIDISSTGTVIFSSGDDVSAPFAATHGNQVLPAGTIFVGTNGYVTASAFTAFTNGTLSGASNRGYYPHWDDLILPPGTIYAQNLADRTIVQWSEVGFFAGQGTVTFQVQIFDNAGGGLQAQYLYGAVAGGGASATIGAVADAVNGFANYSVNSAGGIPTSNCLDVSVVPAPAAAGLLGMGGLVAMRRRR